MDRVQLAEALIASGRSLERTRLRDFRKTEAEGGCGVIGTASSVPLPGRALLRGLEQMKNRGNGKGGGIAAAGLDPAFFGARAELLRDDYLLTLAYVDPSARREVESSFVEPTFEVDHVFELPTCADGLSIRPPDVCCYFARVRRDVRAEFLSEHGIPEEHAEAACDEIVYQSSHVLNRAFYSPTEEQRAFVLSHGKDLFVLKLVGYGDDVVHHYRLEDLEARVWIGHHRYPTKGRVWHPGGAHPFVGVHEALVHNGDFANYASICTYLAQRNRFPLFLTDTEAAVLVFDLLHRVYGYPLEATIEAMAPTTERDFALLPAKRQRLYRLLQAVHVHGSPDGPWFFVIAQSARRDGVCRLVGITDTSMLRPQVFALQRGKEAIGLAASEKQAIDAVLESLSEEDERFWSRADLYWNARGGSHTDGGAFVFTVPVDGEAGVGFLCTDKFGRRIEPDESKRPIGKVRPARVRVDLEPEALLAEIPSWSYGELSAFLDGLVDGEDREHALAVLTLLIDRCYPTGEMKRSCILSLLDTSLASLVEDIRRAPSAKYVWAGRDEPLPLVDDPEAIVVVDARGLPSEGEGSLSRVLGSMHERGLRRFVVAGARGQRFIGCGLGPTTHGTRIDVYGSSGDYLASGLDGAELVVHGTAQDQVAQIMKDGTLTLYGDVGQTFMYAAKGGSVFVLGSAAGRPLINAVGRPRVVINGTCLDYLAESFMAGDPLVGGGFAILNGVAFDEDGALRELETPYPGGNLFSLASGGALYVRDPLEKLTVDQLNGGAFAALGAEDWALVEPCLEENERLFGIPLAFLLTVAGGRQSPERVYRKIQPVEHVALTPEEAWVKRKA